MDNDGNNLNAGAKEWRPNVAAASWTPSWLPAEEAAPAAPAEQAAPAAPAEPAAPPAPADEPAQAAEAADIDDMVAKIGSASVSIGGATEPAKAEESDAAPIKAPAAAETKNAAAAEQASASEEPKVEAAPAPKEIKVDLEGFEKEKVKQLEMIKSADPREHINVVFIGHVDAGKSTLCGSILYSLGVVDKRTIEKYEAEAKEKNRESWFLAYIMDTDDSEREKGKTVSINLCDIELENRRVTIIDAPGHKNYVPSMISGASQADAAILVISARKGEFEAGFEGLGQTREHAMLAKTLGVQKLIVVINKMDESTVKWSQDRYEHCCKKLRPFLKACGFKVKKDVTFLPISALSFINVKDKITADVCPWAPQLNEGKSLLQLIDSLQMSGRDNTKPLRMTILDRYNERGVVIMGKVEAGICFVGQKICVCPNQQEVKIESIVVNENEVEGAGTGENVLLRCSGLNENEVSKGHVICSRFSPIAGATEVIAQVVILNLLPHRPLFSAGYNAVFHAHTAEEECTVYEIAAELDKTGKIAKKNPAYAKAGATIICKIRLDRSICLEAYEKTMELGRFTLRDEGTTIAIGRVKKVR